MADHKLTAARSFWYNGRMLRRGDEFEPRNGETAELTRGRNPLATKGAAKDFDPENATKAELEAEAERRGIEVKGTGKDGNVLVSDLRNALA